MTTEERDRRATRIAALGFDYGRQPKGSVGHCNLCGGSAFTGLTHVDRYGYSATAVGCGGCGLVFLDPVMTGEAYGQFYADTYRPLVSAYHGRVIDARSIQQEQREYARERGDLLAPYLAGHGYRTLLDIGGSTGVVARAIAQRFGLSATVVDPAPLETAEAHRLGIETIEGLVETVDFGDRCFDVVLLCQTVDHLLDIGGTLRRVRALLAPTGLLFVDIVDFRAAYLRNWSIEEAIKIDHPYYLTESTMVAYLRQAGFDVVRTDFAADHLHVSYVARPSQPASCSPSDEDVRALWREIRFVQNASQP
ncbi:MAG: class I SAM-dependent methyltransferase [Acidobacteria bacterium]|nr:class I SAM-dependent methyltransferase [Acidobacteriota bacterium]